MATSLKLRRGTTAQHASFTGSAAEVTVDTDKNTVVVHNGSTAGGIPLAKETNPTLNGNVTTTGLNFDSNTFVIDTTNNRIGLGTASPIGTLDVRTTGDGSRIANLWNTSQGFGFRVRVAGSESYIEAVNTAENAYGTFRLIGNPLSLEGSVYTQFLTAGVERMRIDSSGNVGIGTSSPAFKLDLNGVGAVRAGQAIRYYRSDNGIYTELYDAGAGSGFTTNNANGDGFRWQNGSTTTVMTLNSSGNLGLGVTPSAWGGGTKALQFTSGYVMGVGSGSLFYVGANNYYDGSNYRYVNSSYASQYSQASGEHRWLTAPSGTAGNAITFTQAMTLDASGNLGIGTTSPGANGRFTIDKPGFNQVLVRVNGGDKLILYADTAVSAVDAQNNPLAFYAGNAERARIDTSGNLLVGTTSEFAGFSNSVQIQSSSNGQLGLRNSTSTSGKHWKLGPDGSGNNIIVYNQSGQGVYMIDGATSWSSSSDERLKTTLVPFENAAEKVCSLRAGTGRYLTDEETVSRSFLIAQDVQAVLPEAVNVKDDEMGTLGLSYTDMIPLLTAAIQEQQAIITDLKARIETLESK